MPIVINYKICDLSPECSGIGSCLREVIFWNKKTKRPDVDNTKCTACGACERTCPVGAILTARNEEEFRELQKAIKADPRSETELWRERLGCTPGKTPPRARVITPKNFKKSIASAKGLIALDVWSEETLDCRYHSVLWVDLGFSQVIALRKLDGKKYPSLAKRLNITVFPTLAFLRDGEEVSRHEGYLHQHDQHALVGLMKKFF